MQPNNTIGAPFDPDPDDQLPDNQAPLTDDYLQNSVDDVETNLLDNPEDIPAEERDQLREAVKDDMPGDNQQAAERQVTSPNEQRNKFDESTFDISSNPNPEQAYGSKSVDDAINDEDPTRHREDAI